MPEHMSAGVVGTVNNLTIVGDDPDRGPYVMYMFNGGGYGGFKGGGGYGTPLERDVERVLHDVRQGYISRETARDVYGVILQDGLLEVDREATEAMRRLRLPPGPPAGKHV